MVSRCHKRGVPPAASPRASGGSLEILVRFTYFSVKGNTKGGSAVFGGRGELAGCWRGRRRRWRNPAELA